MADADPTAKAAKVAAAKKKLAAYRKSKKPKKKDTDAGDGDFSDTASEASYATSSDVGSLTSVDDRSTPDSDKLADETIQSESMATLEKQLTIYSNRLAVLEETIDGKDGAIMGLSEENARLMAELDSFKDGGAVNGTALSNGDTHDTHQLQNTIQELTSHLKQYQAAVVQRDQAIQQLSEQSRQLQEQNRQLQTPSRSASEDGIDYAAETDGLKLQVAMLKEQLEQANTSLSRQSAPSPQPIVDARNEIITLQQNLAAQEQALQQLRAAVADRDSLVNQLQSENAAKDESIQALGLKISKKSEALSELSEELDLFKAKDSENVLLISELKSQAKSNESAGGSDADSIASAGYSEDEMEEKQQGLRNTLDEQFGQNMMAIKESMSMQYEESHNSLKKELEATKQQVEGWKEWAQKATEQFQQQLQQQLVALNEQLTEKHNKELLELQQRAASDGKATSSVAVSDDALAKLKEQHEEEMKVLVDTAEEEANNLKEQIRLLEGQVNQSEVSSSAPADSQELHALQEQITQLNADADSSHSELAELKKLYDNSQQQLAGLTNSSETKDSQLSQLVKKLEEVQEEKITLHRRLGTQDQLHSAVCSERDNLKTQLNQLNTELDHNQSATNEMSAEVESLREKCAQLTNSNQELEQAVTAAAVDSEATRQTALSDLKGENSDLLSKISSLTSEVEVLQQRLANDLLVAQQTSDELEAELTVAKTNNISLQEKLAELERSKAEVEGNVGEQLKSLVSENESLQQSLAELSEVKNRLERVSADKVQLQRELDASREDETEKVQTLGQQLEDAKAELENAVLERQSVTTEMSAEVESLREKCAQLTTSNQRLEQAAVAAADDSETAHQTALSDLRGENRDLLSKVSLLTGEVEVLQQSVSEKERLTNDLLVAQQTSDEREAELTSAKSDNNSLQEKLAELERSKAEVEGNVGEQLKSLVSENESLQQSLAELSEVKDRLERVSADKEQLQRELDASRENETERVQTLGQQLEEAKAELENAVLERQSVTTEMSAEVESLREKCAQLTNSNQKFEQAVAAAAEDSETAHQTALADLRGENSDLLSKVSSLTGEVEVLQQSVSEKERLANDWLVAQQTSVELEAELTSAKSDSNSLQEKLAELERSKAEVEDNVGEQLKSLVSENESLRQSLAELSEVKDSLERVSADKEQLQRELDARREDETEKVQTLGQQLEEAKAELENSVLERQRLQEDKDRLSELSIELERVLKEKDLLQDNKVQLESELIEANNKNLQLQESQVELGDQMTQERQQLQEARSECETVRVKFEKALLECQELDETQIQLSEVRAQLENVSQDTQRLAEAQVQLDNVNGQLQRLAAENQQLQEEKLRQLQEAASSDAVKEELTALSTENQAYKRQLSDYEQLQNENERCRNELLEAADKLKSTSEEFNTFRDAHSDYDNLKSQLESMTNDLAISSTATVQLEETLNNVQNELEQSKLSNESLRNESDNKQSELIQYNNKLTQLSTSLEELQHSNQINLDELKLDYQSRLDELQNETLALQQEHDSLLASSQTEISQYQTQVKSLKDKLEQSQSRTTAQASDLTHSFEEEKMILNFKIKDLEAKLEDSRAIAHEDFQDDIKMAVTQALRDQKAGLDIAHEQEMAEARKEKEREMETVRKQIELMYDQKFIQQMNETRNELTKQRQRDAQEMRQAFSNDSAKQMQALYDQIQEKEKALATLNKELAHSQDAITRLSEETMAMEELRSEKESLQAQLDRVHGELEDLDRVASPTEWTDQERLLRENPVLTDQVEDSHKYQSLADENEQLKTLLEQLKESDAGKLRIAFEQLRQENEALREQQQHSLIPDRVETQLTDAGKEEIGSLKKNLAEAVHSRQQVADLYTALHSQYTDLETQYKEALDLAQSQDLIAEVNSLKSFCQTAESRINELSDEREAANAEKEQVVEELQKVQDQLAGTTEAYLKLRSESEAANDTELDTLRARLSQLQDSLESNREQTAREQEAKQSALSELQEANANIAQFKQNADELVRLSQDNESLRVALSKATERSEAPAVHEAVIPMHSTPRSEALPDAAVEMHEDTHYLEHDLSGDVSTLRHDMDDLQARYNKDTADLRLELDVERKNFSELRQEMHESLNSSAQSLDSSNIANLTELVTSMQNKNDKLHAEKQELNKQLMEQERLCEKLHERLGVSESLSTGVQESYAKQLAAARRQRDEILEQLEEATRVNDQVAQLVAERNTLQQERSEVTAKLREKDDLDVELLKLRTQLESLTHSHSKMAATLSEKDQTGLELSKRNAILESAVQQMEGRLRESEQAYQSEKENVVTVQEQADGAIKRRSELEQKLSEEKISYRNRLTAELQQTRAASEKNRLLQIRQERLEIEKKYKEAIEKLRSELIEESKRKQESLRSQHSQQVKQMETQHEKQLKEVTNSSERQIQELRNQLHQQQVAQLTAVKEISQQVKEHEMEQLKTQFEKEAENMRLEMDAAHHEQFDEMLKTHQAQLEQEKQSVQAEMLLQMEELRSTLERSHTEHIQRLTNTFNAENVHSLNVLKSELWLQYTESQANLQEELHLKIAQLEEEHKMALADLNSQRDIEMAEGQAEALKEVVDNYNKQIKALATQHSKELSNLKDELEEKFTDDKLTIEEVHLAQLNTARAQLVISDSLERDYQELKIDLDRLRMERDINSELMNKLVEERDALRQQALESSQRLSKIHDEEMSELSKFFEEKLVESERGHIEEITQLKEEYELMLDSSVAMPSYQKPYHTGDSMTESLRDREKAKTKLYHTMTVLSDLDSSEGSPPQTPRMSADELEQSIAQDKEDRISDLEKEIDELTGKLVETENRVEHHKTELEKLSKEKEDLESKVTSIEHRNSEIEDELNDTKAKLECTVLELKDLHKQEMEAETESNRQLMADYQERNSAELTRCKLQIASLTGQLIEAQTSLDDSHTAAQMKQDELQTTFKEELSAMQSEHEQKMTAAMDDVRESLQTSHSQAMAEFEQQLQAERQQELSLVKQEHIELVAALEEELKSRDEECSSRHEQMENEYKITLDSLQTEKQQVVGELQRVEDDYKKLQAALQDGSAPVLMAVRQELIQNHEEEKANLQQQYEDNVSEITELYESKISSLNSTTEQQLLEFRAEHTSLLEKALEERQAEVKATIEEYEVKLEECRHSINCEHELALKELEVKFMAAIEAEQEVSRLKLEELKEEYETLSEQKERQFQTRLEEDRILLKEQLLAEKRADLDELTEEMKSSSSTALEQLLDSLRQEQADELLQQQDKHEQELKEANQKADDLDAAHAEELKILADDHDQQLQVLQEQLNIQLEKMSTELQTLQTNHECQLQQERDAHNQLLEEALLEQHDNHEQDIARHNEVSDGEREAWDAERLAHEAEVQALQDQLNLERREYQSKSDDSNKRVKELVSQLEGERTRSKETSDLWTSNMDELRAEQELMKEEQQKSLARLEDKYQKQIDSLQTHLQRVVNDNQAKDDLIQQLRAEAAELQEKISKSTDSNDLVSQLQADLEHLKQVRDSVGGTNQKLLELLSGTVETQRSLEAQILGKIGPAQGFNSDGRSTPVNRSSRPGSRAGPPADPSVYGAAANPSPRSAVSNDGTLTPHEKSFDSEMADEGLDLSHMSQTREVSLFAGPYLNTSEEETVLGTGRHLQEVVDMLLSRIENTSGELADVKLQQEELISQLSQRNSQINELKREMTRFSDAREEMEDQVQQLSAENAELRALRSELFQQKELCEELNSANSEAEEQLTSAQEMLNSLVVEVNELKAEREAVQELKAHVEMQHQTMTDGASEGEKTKEGQTEANEELLRMNSHLESEMRTQQALNIALVEELNNRIKDLEAELQISREEREAERQALTESYTELQEQFASLSRTNDLNKQFIEQQTAERELEREEALETQNLLEAANEKLKASEATAISLQAQLTEAESSLHDTSEHHLAEAEANKSETELALADLDEKQQTLARMREVMGSLEEELQGSVRREHSLRTQLDSFQNSQIDRTQFEEPAAPSGSGLLENLSQRLEDSLKALQVLREERDSLSDQIEILKAASEEYMEEKATLQSTVYEHMSLISSLKSQLEAGRHLGGAKPAEPSQVEQLAERLHTAKDALERKEHEAETLAEELTKLQTLRETEEQKEEEIRSQYEGMLETERASNEQLQGELEVLKAAANEMPINELMKALIEDKDEEIRQLQEKMDKETAESAASSELQALEEKLVVKGAEADELTVALTAKSAKVEELELLLEAEKSETASLVQFTNDLTADFEKIQAVAEEKETQLATTTTNLELLEEERTALLDEKENFLQKIIVLERQTRESQNVVNEKEEEMYLLNEKLEELEKENAETLQTQEEILLQKEKLSETNKELAVEVGTLRKLAAEREHQVAQSQEETNSVKAKCDSLSERLAELKQSLEDTDQYRLHCEQLAKQLAEMRAGDEVTKADIDSMISEKISLALELEQSRQQSADLTSKLASSEAEVRSINDSINESLNELDAVRAALLDTQAQHQALKAEHEQVVVERDNLTATLELQQETMASSTAMSLEQTADVETLQQTMMAESSLLQKQLEHTDDELKLTIADRDELVKEVSSLRDQLDGLSQLTETVNSLKEEKAELELRLAASHDAQLVDERLGKLQEELEAQLKDKEREIQQMSEETQEQIASQRESYEETIALLNERINQMRGEFEQRYEQLKEQVLDQVSHTLHDTMADESFSESLRKDIEGRITLITNGHYSRDSDQDTLADTASVTSSTLGDDAPVKDRQKHHLDQIEKESNSIYKLSHKTAAVGDSLLESILQEKEVLNATIQSLKDLLSQVDQSRSTAQMNDNVPTDWRAALIQGVHQVFQHERELYLQELRTFVAARADLQPSEVDRLESRLRSLTARQEVGLDQLFQIDRQSLLDEIAEHRTLANNMKNETVQILSRLERQKTEAKQQAEMNDAKLLQHVALIEDSNKALSAEQKRNANITQELSTLRDKCFSLETNLASSHAEIEHAKQLLATEHHKLASLQNQLSDERTKNNMLDMQLRQHVDEEQRLHEQMQSLEKERLAERDDAHNVAQTLRQEAQLLKDENSEANAKLERETLVHQTTKRQLVQDQHDAANRERQIKSHVAQLELTLDMERAKQLELSQELNQEKSRVEGMRKEIVELETRPPLTEYKLVCDQLDSEKSRALDIQSALERERNRSANLSAALDLARAQALEEVENERRIVAQLKGETKSKQRELEDLRCQLQSERATIGSLREELSQLQMALEDANSASFEAQRRLALEQAAMQHERAALRDAAEANVELKQRLADAEVTIAEKERIVESQHRDITKMRNQLGRTYDDSSDELGHSSTRSKNIYKRLRLIALRLKEASDNTQNELGDVFNELTLLNDAFNGPTDSGDGHASPTPGPSAAATQAGLSSYWLGVINDLYSRMRKAEARVRGLTYQKKVVLLQLGGYEECEEEVLRRLTNMGAINSTAEPAKIPARRRFRAAVKVVITTRRLRWLVSRSRKLVRDGVQALIRHSHDQDVQTAQAHSRPDVSTVSPLSRPQSQHSHRPDSRVSSSKPGSSKARSSGSRSHKAHGSNHPLSEVSQPCSTVYGTGSRKAQEVTPDRSVKKDPSRSAVSSRSASVQSSRPPSQQSVQSSVSRQSNRSLHADGNRKASSKASTEEDQRSSSPSTPRSLTPVASYIKPPSPGSQRSIPTSSGHRSITPLATNSHRSTHRTVSPRTVSPTVPVPGSAQYSRRHTPKSSARGSPTPRESQSSPALTTSSYNPSRHTRCFPQETYDRPVDHHVSHDDSVVENINRLERLQERLTEMQKPT